MEINISRENNTITVCFSGRLDTPAAQEITPQMNALAEEASNIIILDCSELTYMASSGLRVIQKTMRTVMQLRGKFKMTNVSPDIYKVLKMTGFTQFMTVEQKKG